MLRAIDVHVHPPNEPGRPVPAYQAYVERFFRSGPLMVNWISAF